MALAAGDQDVVPLLVEPDGEDPVRGGGGGGEEDRLDLLLLKLGPDRDVWLVRAINYGKLRTTLTCVDREGKGRHLGRKRIDKDWKGKKANEREWMKSEA